MGIPRQPSKHHVWDGEKWELDKEALLEEFRSQKIREIQQKSDSSIASITSGYTTGERESFAQQKQGASDILNSTPSSEATYVRDLADGRVLHGDTTLGGLEGEARYAAFAHQIMQNAETAELAALDVLCKQQGLEVRARLAETIEDLQAITW